MTPWILAVLGLFAVQTFLPVGLRVAMSGNSPGENLKYGLGGRDDPPPLTPLAARAGRALSNMQEALPAFLAVALLLEMKGSVSPVAVYGAMGFFVMRLLYVPAYLSAIPGIRSTCWMASWAGVGAMIYALLS